MQTNQTSEARRAELNARLDALLTATACRVPNSPAMQTAKMLDSSLRGSPCENPAKHVQTLNLITSCIEQVMAGKTTLDLNRRHQPTVEAARRHLDRILPR